MATVLTRLRLGGVVAGVTIAVGLVDMAGGFTRLETWTYDLRLRGHLPVPPEPRLVIVALTPADLGQRARITDRDLERLLRKLLAEGAAVVGVDVIRDVPVGERRAQRRLVQLVNQRAQAPQGHIVLTCFLPDEQGRGILPPPGLQEPVAVVGFADVVPDADGVVRRQVLYVQPSPEPPARTCPARYALGFLTALRYLEQQGYPLRVTPQQQLQIQRTVMPSLTPYSAAYRRLDAAGYQVLLRYRRPSSLAPVVTMTQVLQGTTPVPLRQRVVLVGYAEGTEKPVLTPLGPLPSVQFHAQTTAQVLQAVLAGESWPWSWPLWGQGLWLLLWSSVGAGIGWRAQRRWGPEPLAATGLLLGTTLVASWAGGWIPLVAPLVAYALSGMGVWWGLPRPLAVWRRRSSRPLASVIDPQGRYVTAHLLSQDELSWVYAAQDQRVGKTVVVRVLKLTPSPQRRQELLQTFAAQVQRYVALNSLHLMQILDFGLTHEGFLFYVREYFPGCSLQQRLREHPRLAVSQAVHLVRQICQGLAPAHQQGWVHQDLKPANIFLIPTGLPSGGHELVKILDFGLTPWINETTANTTLGASRASLPYTAPELFCGGTAQPSADVYSLGVLLYRLIAGHYPYPCGDTATFHAWCDAHQHQEPCPCPGWRVNRCWRCSGVA